MGIVLFLLWATGASAAGNLASWIPFTKAATSDPVSKGEDMVAEVCQEQCRIRFAQSQPSLITPAIAAQPFYVMNGGFNNENGGYYFVFQDIWMMRQTAPTEIEYKILVHRTPSWPVERDGAQFRVMQNGDILLYGGYNYDIKYYLNGVFVFDTLTLSWITLQPDDSEDGPLPRAWGFMQSLRVLPNGDEEFFMFAGEGSLTRIAWTEHDKDFRDSWVLTLGKSGPGGTYQFSWRNTNEDNCTKTETTCSDAMLMADMFPNVTLVASALYDGFNEATRPNVWGDHLIELANMTVELGEKLTAVIGGPGSGNSPNDPDACQTICTESELPLMFPSGRDATRFRVYKGRVFLFGGYACIRAGSYSDGGDTCFPNTVHIYNYTSNEWSILSRPARADDPEQYALWPSGRSYHNLELHENKLWITAGAYISTVSVFTYFNDMHVFNLDTLKFEPVEVRGPVPNGRWDATSVMDHGKMWFMQGTTTAGNLFGDEWMLAVGQAVTAANVTALGAALSHVTAGEPQTVLLDCVESDGSPLEWGVGLSQFFEVSVVVEVAPNPGNIYSRETVLLSTGTVEESDAGDGHYIMRFTAQNGPVNLFVKFDGVDIPGSPFQVTVDAASATATTTYAQSAPVAVQASSAFIDIQLQDGFANPSDHAGASFDLFVNGQTADHRIEAASAYLGQGLFRLTYDTPDLDGFLLYVHFNGSNIIGSPFAVPRFEQPGVSQNTRTGMMVLAGLGMAIIVVLMIAVFVHREQPIVRAATPLFTENMLLGSLIGAGSVFAYATESDAACQAFPFVLGIAYVLLLGSLYVKTWRLMIIFRQSQMRLIRISLWYMSKILISLLVVEVAFNIAWQVSNQPMLQTVDANPDPLTYKECGASMFNTWQGASYAYKAVFLFYGIFLSVMTRGLPDAYNESAWIGVSIYNVGLSGGVVLLVVYAGKTQDTLTGVFVLVCVAIVWVSVGTALLMTAPKFYRIYFGSKKDDDMNKSSIQEASPPAPTHHHPHAGGPHVDAANPSQSEPLGLMMVDQFEGSKQHASQLTSTTGPTTVHPTSRVERVELSVSPPASPPQPQPQDTDRNELPIVQTH